MLVEGGTIVAGSANGELTALRLETGEPLWSESFEGAIRGIERSGGTYLVGTQAGTIYAYRR